MRGDFLHLLASCMIESSHGQARNLVVQLEIQPIPAERLQIVQVLTPNRHTVLSPSFSTVVLMTQGHYTPLDSLFKCFRVKQM